MPMNSDNTEDSIYYANCNRNEIARAAAPDVPHLPEKLVAGSWQLKQCGKQRVR